MKNLNIEVVDQQLVIRVDLTAQGEKTGKGNELVATSGNWQRVPELAGYSLNMVLVKKS